MCRGPLPVMSGTRESSTKSAAPASTQLLQVDDFVRQRGRSELCSSLFSGAVHLRHEPHVALSELGSKKAGIFFCGIVRIGIHTVVPMIPDGDSLLVTAGEQLTPLKRLTRITQPTLPALPVKTAMLDYFRIPMSTPTALLLATTETKCTPDSDLDMYSQQRGSLQKLNYMLLPCNLLSTIKHAVVSSSMPTSCPPAPSLRPKPLTTPSAAPRCRSRRMRTALELPRPARRRLPGRSIRARR